MGVRVGTIQAIQPNIGANKKVQECEFGLQLLNGATHEVRTW